MPRSRICILELVVLVALAAVFVVGVQNLWNFGLALMGPLLRALTDL